MDKPLIWLGSSRGALKEFPDDARRVAGFQLRRVQQGFEPNDWKPLTTVGVGVKEIRIHTGVEHRVLYLAALRKGSTFCMRSKSARERPLKEIPIWRANDFVS